MWQVMKQKQEGTDVALTNVSKKKNPFTPSLIFFLFEASDLPRFFFI